MSSFLGKIYSRFPTSQRFERVWKIAHIDFKKRYYNSYFGLLWALVNPLFRVAIFYFVFTMFFPTSIENYGLYLFSGLITWMFFKECSTKCMNSLRQKSYLIDSLQFDKIDLFYSTGISSTMGYVFNLSAYMVAAALVGLHFNLGFFLIIPIILNIFILSIGIGMILATIQIYFRDISYFWELAMLLGFWTSPILFRGEAIMEKAPFLLYLNPMSGVILNSRAMLMDASLPNWYWFAADFILAIGFFLIGKAIFYKFSHKALEYI